MCFCDTSSPSLSSDETASRTTPNEFGHGTTKSSTLGAFTNTLLGFFGVGLLTMPYGMRYVGMVGGPVLITLIAIITCYCFLLVVWTKVPGRCCLLLASVLTRPVRSEHLPGTRAPPRHLVQRAGH